MMMVVPFESIPDGPIMVDVDDAAVDLCCGTVGKNVCGCPCWNEGLVIGGGPPVVLFLSAPARYSSHGWAGGNWEIKLFACALTSCLYCSQDWACVVGAGLIA